MKSSNRLFSFSEIVDKARGFFNGLKEKLDAKPNG
jgi:hypothetical protein